jgi:hypothetical protein
VTNKTKHDVSEEIIRAGQTMGRLTRGSVRRGKENRFKAI